MGTFIGGGLVDDCDAVAADAEGNVYLACHVVSTDLPGISNLAVHPDDPMNAYIVKLSGNLDKAEWGVMLAGSKYDGAFDIAVSAEGHVFVTGLTGSTDFPVTSNAVQKVYGGGDTDAFFAEISPRGEPLQVSFLGGSKTDQAFALELDQGGNLWLAGATWSPDFPGEIVRFGESSVDADAFLTRLSRSGTAELRSVIFSGQRYEKITGIVADTDGHVYVAGLTESTDFPVTNALQSSLGGDGDGFVAKLSRDDLRLVYSTFFGGAGKDAVWGLDLLNNGGLVIAGTTTSDDLKTTTDAFQRIRRGGEDVFIASLSPAGTILDYCSYFGGTGADSAGYDGRSIAVDRENRIWLAGQTTSVDLPTRDAPQKQIGGDTDGFVARLALGNGLEFATYIGGPGRDLAEGLALAPNGSVWITGLTASSGFPFPLVFQKEFGGGEFDCFLVRLNRK